MKGRTKSMRNTAASRKYGRHKRSSLKSLNVLGRPGKSMVGPGGCLHALARYEEAVDHRGRAKTMSYAVACVVRHTKKHDGNKWVNAQPHKDALGREWE
jgi:hypothetical protein